MDKPSHWVIFLNYIFNPNGWVCPYFTQNWVKTTQHFLECTILVINKLQILTHTHITKLPQTVQILTTLT